MDDDEATIPARRSGRPLARRNGGYFLDGRPVETGAMLDCYVLARIGPLNPDGSLEWVPIRFDCSRDAPPKLIANGGALEVELGEADRFRWRSE